MYDHITEGETAGFAEALLNAGAKVGSRDDLLKSTALGWACRWLLVAIAFFLIADIDSPRGGVIRVQPQNLVLLDGSLRGK